MHIPYPLIVAYLELIVPSVKSITEAESWAEASNSTVKRSQSERSRSCQLRSDIEITINGVAQEMWDAWSNTNNALARRSAEMLEAKSKLQIHLHKVSMNIIASQDRLIIST